MDGKIDIDLFVTHRFSIDDYEKGFQAVKDKNCIEGSFKFLRQLRRRTHDGRVIDSIKKEYFKETKEVYSNYPTDVSRMEEELDRLRKKKSKASSFFRKNMDLQNCGQGC